MHCTLGDSRYRGSDGGNTCGVYVCKMSVFAYVAMHVCIRQLQLQRQQKSRRFMESKGEADWIMGKKRRNVLEGGREKIRDRERERKRGRYCGPT